MHTFTNCKTLVIIAVDASWVLPSTASSISTFLGDNSLVGGNGFRLTSSDYNYYYARIDKVGTLGYLTAG